MSFSPEEKKSFCFSFLSDKFERFVTFLSLFSLFRHFIYIKNKLNFFRACNVTKYTNFSFEVRMVWG
jgi:hypothetical protein